MNLSQSQILFVVAHPQLERSRANRAITQAVTDCPVSGNITFTTAIRTFTSMSGGTGAVVESPSRGDATSVVLVFDAPLMKLWLDEVFASGWAYGPGGDKLRANSFWCRLRPVARAFLYDFRLQSLSHGCPVSAMGSNGASVQDALAETARAVQLHSWLAG